VKKDKGSELRLVLGDQLHGGHSWYGEVDPSVVYVLMEVRSETDYVRHHIQKVIAIFAAMRHFAEELREKGHRVHYISLDDADNRHSFADNVSMLVELYQAERVVYQLPDEFRVDRLLCGLSLGAGCDVLYVDTEHFLTTRDELASFFTGKKTYLMESFYRHMRKKYDILMDGKKPVTGRWNYDAENRNKLPLKEDVPEPLLFVRDVSGFVELLERCGVETMGTVSPESFGWPVSRDDSLLLLSHFASVLLPRFGRFQDAMDERCWSLFHSRLSFSLNVKMLHPLEVIEAALSKWEEGEASIAQVEGFVRQILGWREFVRGIYWAHMPEYAESNALEHGRELPAFYWTGETNMRCIRHTVTQSLEFAYAHHIQRLMVTGNFALLAGCAPDAVDAWYLGIYIDAFEWVEMPNTRGMSQFADGGIVGTKPYVSSANYINKMSRYCGNCAYDPKRRHGEGACPFNSLYWHFFARHREKFGANPRIGMAYRHLDRMAPEEYEAVMAQAEHYVSRLDTL
jgi:deoxyribodipyrimidine photolyase-related protein